MTYVGDKNGNFIAADAKVVPSLRDGATRAIDQLIFKNSGYTPGQAVPGSTSGTYQGAGLRQFNDALAAAQARDARENPVATPATQRPTPTRSWEPEPEQTDYRDEAAVANKRMDLRNLLDSAAHASTRSKRDAYLKSAELLGGYDASTAGLAGEDARSQRQLRYASAIAAGKAASEEAIAAGKAAAEESIARAKAKAGYSLKDVLGMQNDLLGIQDKQLSIQDKTRLAGERASNGGLTAPEADNAKRANMAQFNESLRAVAVNPADGKFDPKEYARLQKVYGPLGEQGPQAAGTVQAIEAVRRQINAPDGAWEHVVDLVGGTHAGKVNPQTPEQVYDLINEFAEGVASGKPFDHAGRHYSKADGEKYAPAMRYLAPDKFAQP